MGVKDRLNSADHQTPGQPVGFDRELLLSRDSEFLLLLIFDVFYVHDATLPVIINFVILYIIFKTNFFTFNPAWIEALTGLTSTGCLVDDACFYREVIRHSYC